MKRVEYSFELDLNFSMETLGIAPDKAVFFDIETTGLSAHMAGLYLIGAVFFEPLSMSWRLLQLFAESAADEPTMLEEFFRLLDGRSQLVSFNGEGFDIPFLRKVCAQYNLTHPLDRLESYDIYRMLRPAKRLLMLKSYKLKSCEEFLGIYREDRFSGQELIQVYMDYLRERDDERLSMLLLHNAEDLKNLPMVLPILSYSYLTSASARLTKTELTALPTGDGTVLDLHYETELNLPIPLDIDLSNTKKSVLSPQQMLISLYENKIELSIRLFSGELKYYFPDYKSYYYLPKEDTAIHSSLAEFVDSRHRKKASPKTAYQRKKGLFLPELSPVFTPVFLPEYKSRLMYSEWTDEMFTDEAKASAYLRDAFRLL